MKLKTFKTIDEQIEILRNKGLIIDDVDSAKEILLRENYFFLLGYRHVFLRDESSREFIPGTNFRELYALFTFDRQVRNIIFKNLLIVENNIKSILSYQLSKKYGIKERNYLNPNNFTKDPQRSRQVNDLIKKMKRQIRVNGGQHSATMHYLTNYGYIPLWIVVKVLSFGIVSELYSILTNEDQNDIAELFNVNRTDLVTYLSILSNFRNLCAHEDILFDHRTHRVISDTKYHHYLNIAQEDGEFVYGKEDLFALILILKHVLRKADFSLLMNELSYEIDVLDGRVHSIEIRRILELMGFPENYKDIVRL